MPRPATYWVILDEHPDSINDGYFLNNPDPNGASTWGDIPASYHNSACGLAFAAWHSEIHKWVSSLANVKVSYRYPNVNASDRLAHLDWACSPNAPLCESKRSEDAGGQAIAKAFLPLVK